MIKIEQLLNGATATFTLDGAESVVFVGQILDDEVAAQLKVSGGTLVYSINEGELVEVNGGGAPAKAAPAPAPAAE